LGGGSFQANLVNSQSVSLDLVQFDWGFPWFVWGIKLSPKDKKPKRSGEKNFGPLAAGENRSGIDRRINRCEVMEGKMGMLTRIIEVNEHYLNRMFGLMAQLYSLFLSSIQNSPYFLKMPKAPVISSIFSLSNKILEEPLAKMR
jgi:hypothetical protein